MRVGLAESCKWGARCEMRKKVLRPIIASIRVELKTMGAPQLMQMSGRKEEVITPPQRAAPVYDCGSFTSLIQLLYLRRSDRVTKPALLSLYQPKRQAAALPSIKPLEALLSRFSVHLSAH